MEIVDSDLFEKLMPFRIKKVLLVSPLYDSFLFADDEMLSEVLFEHNLNIKEHLNIVRSKNIEEAQNQISVGCYDIVISTIQDSDDTMLNFIKNVKNKNIPFVLLSFSMQDINLLDDEIKKIVDAVFLWQGDTRIFSSIINLIEDRINLKHDLKFGVQCVLLVEDNIKFYSMYLPIIYHELIKQMHIVMSDELNLSKKILRMKARPKIYLAKSYDEAWEIFNHYNNNLLGVITDVEYPISISHNEKAGILLAKKVKELIPDMPVLVQSSNQEYEDVALKLGASFLNKNSGDISKQIRDFIKRYFGFGDFIFDDGKGNEIARCADLSSMIKILKLIPDNSILYHASRNHFSKWLLARTEFDIAYKIKPKKIEEFGSANNIRKYLIETIHQFMYKTQLGSILKFDKNKYDLNVPFAKIGLGSIGGKARGLAFLDYLLGRGILKENIAGININIPNSVVIASDVFDFFIEHNGLSEFLDLKYSDDDISKIFENVNLPDYALKDITALLDKMKGPLAVRSSSLLEDSKNYPFAGIYKTFMFYNGDRVYESLKTIEKIIKYIYASTFSKQAIEFRKSNPYIPDEEKMSVIIQQVVGRQYIKGYHFPLMSGVLQSYNFYPIYPLKSTDPVVHIAMGLGEAVVGGRYFLRYSPSSPNNIHQFATIDDIFKTSQKKFIALPIEKFKEISYDENSSLEELELEDVELSPEMKMLFSSYISQDDKMVDYFIENGSNVLTFFPIIKNNLINLNEALVEISKVISENMGSQIEIEFSVDMDIKNSYVELNILQVRHLPTKINTKRYNIELSDKKKIIYSTKVVGNSYINNIFDMVYVKKEKFDNLKTIKIAEEVSKINAICKEKKTYYLLIGPGRWGTSDVHLGIPVKWNDISMAKVIVEANYDSFKVEPSYGTHFFHNIVAMSIPYFSVSSNNDFIDWNILNSQQIIYETEYVKWIRFNNPFGVLIEDNGLVFI